MSHALLLETLIALQGLKCQLRDPTPACCQNRFAELADVLPRAEKEAEKDRSRLEKEAEKERVRQEKEAARKEKEVSSMQTDKSPANQ